MTTRFKVIALLFAATIALTAAALVKMESSSPAERSISSEAAAKIATLETAESDATAKLQAVAGLLLAPIQQQLNDAWAGECKTAGYPLAECRPDAKRRVVTRVKAQDSKPPAK